MTRVRSVYFCTLLEIVLRIKRAPASRADRLLSVLAQTAETPASSVRDTLRALMRIQQVTLRMGRKGEMHEEIYDVCGIVRPVCG
jgi:hypothetical protein